MRLDKYLSENIDYLSRSKIQGLINDGKVTINGENEKSSYKLNGDESIVIYYEENNESKNIHLPQEIPLNIIYEDEQILIIDKQPGLVVHPGNGINDNTLLNGLKLVGDYLDKSILRPNGLRHPFTRIHFINTLK